MQAVMETYAGWNSAVYFTEENRDSAHSIPRALFFSVLLVMSIYLLVNAALIYALPHSVMAASKLPAADAAAAIFGSNGGKFITTLALVSIVGILNAMVLYMPRTLFAMSRDGMLPSSLSSVNSGGTPVPAMLATVGTHRRIRVQRNVRDPSFDRRLPIACG
jgi:APA family basic amino acid/polyamine antiporter